MRWNRFASAMFRGGVVVILSISFAGIARARQIPQPKRRTPAPPTTQRARPPEAQIDFWLVPDKEIPDGVHLGTFDSKIAGKPVSFIYYLPPKYDADKFRRFPVIYQLPGLGGDCRETARMLLSFDDAIRRNQCPPVIVIGVQGILGSFYTDAKNGKRPIESVIIQELIPHIDATFRTIARADARGVEGFSMGGYGAAHLAFKYPNLFGSVSILSAPIGNLKALKDEMPEYTADVWSDDQEYFADNDPYVLAARNVEKLHGKMKIRIVCGSDDRYRIFADDLHDQLIWLDIDHDFKIVPDTRRNLGRLLARLEPEVFSFWKDTLSTDQPAGK